MLVKVLTIQKHLFKVIYKYEHLKLIKQCNFYLNFIYLFNRTVKK